MTCNFKILLFTQLSDCLAQAVERTGLLGQLVASLHTSDLLLQLNTLELLTKLAITRCSLNIIIVIITIIIIISHGLSYLESAGVMGSLATMLQDCPNLPFSEVILPGAGQDCKIFFLEYQIFSRRSGEVLGQCCPPEASVHPGPLPGAGVRPGQLPAQR